MTDAATDDRLLLMHEVAEITRLSIDGLRWLRQHGGGPPSFRLGKRVVYSESELREWIREQREADRSEVTEPRKTAPAQPRGAVRRRKAPARQPSPAA